MTNLSTQERIVLTAVGNNGHNLARVETTYVALGRLGLREEVTIDVIVPGSTSLVELRAAAYKHAITLLQGYLRDLEGLDDRQTEPGSSARQ